MSIGHIRLNAQFLNEGVKYKSLNKELRFVKSLFRSLERFLSRNDFGWICTSSDFSKNSDKNNFQRDIFCFWGSWCFQMNTECHFHSKIGAQIWNTVANGVQLNYCSRQIFYSTGSKVHMRSDVSNPSHKCSTRRSITCSSRDGLSGSSDKSWKMERP